jgi:hypothetical protein
MSEIWKAIPGYGDHYEASSEGRIRVKDRYVEKRHSSGRMMRQFYPGRLLSPTRGNKWGHRNVHIGIDRQRITIGVHRLVLMAFVGMPPEGTEACHSNGDAGDNRPGNLRWDTHHANNQDRKRHGRYATGEAHPMALLRKESVAEIRRQIAECRPRKQILAWFGISSSTYHRIKNGESWA